MKINDGAKPPDDSKRSASKHAKKAAAKPEPQRTKVADRDELIANALNPAGPYLAQPINVSPPAQAPLQKPTSEESRFLQHPLLHAFDHDIAELHNVQFGWDEKPAGLLTHIFGVPTDSEEIMLPQIEHESFYRKMLPKHLYFEVAGANQSGMSIEFEYANAFYKMKKIEWDKRLHPVEDANKEKTYTISAYGTTTSLRLDQILTLLALKTSHSDLFVRLIHDCMGSGAYLPYLASRLGNPMVTGNVACILHGTMACASQAFGHKSVKHIQIGKNLFKSYFANIETVKRMDGVKADASVKDALRKMSEHMFAKLAERLKGVINQGSDAAYTKATMETGVYAAMMMQAAIEHAEKHGKDAETKARLVTICADLIIVGVTAAVASHFPPILAVIPAALTFVSTHVVPFFVPKTDFRAPLLHMRAAAKTGSLAKLTAPIDDRYPTHTEMQQRLFYHELFFAPWDIVADACAGI